MPEEKPEGAEPKQPELHKWQVSRDKLREPDIVAATKIEVSDGRLYLYESYYPKGKKTLVDATVAVYAEGQWTSVKSLNNAVSAAKT